MNITTTHLVMTFILLAIIVPVLSGFVLKNYPKIASAVQMLSSIVSLVYIIYIGYTYGIMSAVGVFVLLLIVSIITSIVSQLATYPLRAYVPK